MVPFERSAKNRKQKRGGGGGGGGGAGGGAGTFLMEHMVTFRKFRFYHPPTPSANEIQKSTKVPLQESAENWRQ